MDFGDNVFSSKEFIKASLRSGGATKEEIAAVDHFDQELINEYFKILHEEVQKEINKEIIKCICYKAKKED